MKLTIAIPTIQSRVEQFDKLFTFIAGQIYENNLSEFVELIYLCDNKEITIGEKRNRLVAMAKGDYLVMIDDDDNVHDNYVKWVYEALKENPDCVGYKELCVYAKGITKKSVFSKKYRQWQDNFGGFDFVRTPFYKSPLRIEIYKDHPFQNISFGEDHEFAKIIYHFLKAEVFIDEFMYIYQHNNTDHAS